MVEKKSSMGEREREREREKLATLVSSERRVREERATDVKHGGPVLPTETRPHVLKLNQFYGR